MGKGQKRKSSAEPATGGEPGPSQQPQSSGKDTDFGAQQQQHGKDQSTAPKKGGKKTEIDDIFGGAKGAKKKSEDAAKAKEGTGSKEEEDKGQRHADTQKKPKIVGNKDDLFGEETKQSRKRTEEGYVIYTEEELGMLKKGGDTPDCPFDCNCCF